ncbi:carboxypeptidase regulatory-like domain-containing protein, partial [Cellulomonas rhizosphaerae]
APAEEIEVELHQGGDTTVTVSDEDGRFSFVDVDRGPARLVLRRPSDPTVPVVTPQIEL